MSICNKLFLFYFVFYLFVILFLFAAPITEKPQEEDVFIQPVVDHTKMNAE